MSAFKPFTAALLLAAISAPAVSAEPAKPLSPVTEQFAQRCMATFFKPNALIEQMRLEGVELVEGEAARFFLTRKPGLVWRYPSDGLDYVVALRDDGICATFAKDADLNQAEQAFIALAGSAPSPLEATRLPGDQHGPNEGELKTIAYGWGPAGQAPSIVFAMTTSREDTPLVRVMISLTRVGPAKKSATAPEASAAAPPPAVGG